MGVEVAALPLGERGGPGHARRPLVLDPPEEGEALEGGRRAVPHGDGDAELAGDGVEHLLLLGGEPAVADGAGEDRVEELLGAALEELALDFGGESQVGGEPAERVALLRRQPLIAERRGEGDGVARMEDLLLRLAHLGGGEGEGVAQRVEVRHLAVGEPVVGEEARQDAAPRGGEEEARVGAREAVVDEERRDGGPRYRRRRGRGQQRLDRLGGEVGARLAQQPVQPAPPPRRAADREGRDPRRGWVGV
jgi:hypothetical protein